MAEKQLQELPKLEMTEALQMLDDEKSELDKLMELMLDPRNILHNTELTQREIRAFSALSTMGKQYGLLALNNWLLENLTMRVSKGRAGRKEWVRIAGRQMENVDKQFNQQNTISRWWAGRKK